MKVKLATRIANVCSDGRAQMDFYSWPDVQEKQAEVIRQILERVISQPNAQFNLETYA